jgi:hypothetical protein
MNNCPYCHVSLQGTEIPEKHRESYGGKTHFGREIGVEIAEAYDGVLYWKCPDCLMGWPRFTSGAIAYMHKLSVKYCEANNRREIEARDGVCHL